MIRTAIIGLGKVAETIHLPAVDSVHELKLIAASDPRPERLVQVRHEWKVPGLYENSVEMLAKEQPDLVIIGTPPDSHKELCIAALRQGCDVLCEKPFVLTIEEADEVLAEAKRHNRMVAVNTQYRHMNMYRTAREKIESNEYGRLFFMHVWQQMFHPPAFEGHSWRSQLKQSTLYEFGSHPLDLICHMMGDLPESVTCHTPRVRPEFDSDVLVQMTLRFPDERLATMALNRVSHAPERYLEMRLDCENASMRASLGGVAKCQLEMTRANGRSMPSARLSVVKGGELRVESGGKSTLLASEPRPAFAKATADNLRQLIEHRKSCRRPQKSAEHARDILRIIFAGYKSAQQGTTVKIDYEHPPEVIDTMPCTKTSVSMHAQSF
ncbi:MAG TPA: Gfo/Idh/MocA family oxidoreductase [Planktothrix sp.]